MREIRKARRGSDPVCACESPARQRKKRMKFVQDHYFDFFVLLCEICEDKFANIKHTTKDNTEIYTCKDCEETIPC